MHIKENFDEFSAAFSIVLPYLKEIMGQDMALNISNQTHFLHLKMLPLFISQSHLVKKFLKEIQPSRQLNKVSSSQQMFQLRCMESP